MRQNSLSTTGLSLSQAQSISNMCNQRAKEIANQFSSVNNFSKVLELEGKSYVETAGKPLPVNTKELLLQKAALHATQAFLMENIKAKNEALQSLALRKYSTDVMPPAMPEMVSFIKESSVNEEWGWEQLSSEELSEFYEAEAFASAIGRFIHKDGILDTLREELPNLPSLGWISVKDGERLPVSINVHHTSQDLLSLYEELAVLHRKYEQRVNYFKAKVKNLVTLENAEIAKRNGIKQAEVNEANAALVTQFKADMNAFEAKIKLETEQFEAERQNAIKTVASLRIMIPARFQSVVDMFVAEVS